MNYLKYLCLTVGSLCIYIAIRSAKSYATSEPEPEDHQDRLDEQPKSPVTEKPRKNLMEALSQRIAELEAQVYSDPDS